MAGHVLGYVHTTSFRLIWLCLVSFAVALLLVSTRLSAASPAPEDAWASLAQEIFKGRPLVDGTGLVGIEMPARAEDAAIVPVTMRVTLPTDDSRRLKTLTLVIDDNPVPVAATFTFGDNAGVSVISTRVRINSYTEVHVIAELSDSKLYFAKTYVKASGGCSAPAAKNPDEAIASLGQMKFRVFGNPSGGPAGIPREAQIMIRHPNNSGLQRDQMSLLYIPANFVDELHVWQGDALLFSMKAGISISEDPNFRFTYLPNGATTFRVEARDAEGKVFQSEWPAITSEM
jgi:sulfur-oxidizing protein SoxY